MPNYNKVILMGHLTRDPQMKMLPSQTPLTEFGIAVNRKWKTQAGEDRDEVAFIDITAFGKVADAHDTNGGQITRSTFLRIRAGQLVDEALGQSMARARSADDQRAPVSHEPDRIPDFDDLGHIARRPITACSRQRWG